MNARAGNSNQTADRQAELTVFALDANAAPPPDGRWNGSPDSEKLAG